MTDVKDLIAALADTAPDPAVKLRQGVVQAVTGETVTVTIGGSETPVTGFKHLASYTPVVGDTVWLATDGRDWIVLGTLGSGDSWGNLDGGLPNTVFGGGTVADGGGV